MRYASPKGYTLLEMMVSVAIFSIVMVAAMSAYLTLISIDKQARATNALVNNLSFAVDDMARSIRTGSSYNCDLAGGNCPSGSIQSQFSFVDSNGCSITYFLKQNAIYEKTGSGSANCNTSNVSLTDPGIIVDTLKFYVNGTKAGTNDDTQPTVTFIIHGTMTTDSKTAPASFAIETSATQRLIDL